MTELEQSVLALSQVTIGVITALPEEFAACKRVCDPQSLGQNRYYRATSGNLSCWICAVPARGGGQHVVAITLLADMGNNSAAIGANILLQHCPNVKYVLMCGIAGAVPCPSDVEKHVRLGDVVISSGDGVIQYDRGKRHMLPPSQGISQPEPIRDPLDGFELRSQPRPPHPDLLHAVREIKADLMISLPSQQRRWDQLIVDFLSSVDAESWIPPQSDVLDDSHKNAPESPTPHPMRSKKRKISRGRGRRAVPSPELFSGPIASANTVLSDPDVRNALRDKHNIRAVEMEASGLADATWVAGVGYLIIRGTCDYCNSRKNNGWHHFAALVAAAFTRSLIEHLYPVPTAHRSDELILDQTSISSAQPRKAISSVPPIADVPSFPTPAIAVRPIDSTETTEEVKAVRFEQKLNSASTSVAAFVQQPEELPDASLVRAEAFKEIIELTSELKRATDAEDFQSVPTVFAELKAKVSKLPRRGTTIRDAWDALYDAELRRLRIAQRTQSIEEFDSSLLDECRKEADLAAVDSN